MRKAIGKAVALAALVSFASGCATVTINEKGTQKITSAPSKEQSHDFYFWGLVGEHEVDVAKVCNGKPARQMQTQATAVNVALSVVTLGIYMPRSSKVWCG